MKILYVKVNSERAKEFQLKTIIFEEGGHKFVKKQAMCDDAIPHLKKMKTSYIQLSESILNPNIKLAKIIDESTDSLTFEFIDGMSLESKYNHAKRLSNLAVNKIIQDYMALLSSGFKTTSFDSKSMITDEFKRILGDFDYSEFDGQLCFEGISNIDLIFSNIIFKDNDIYLIDYEWVFNLNIPINFSAFRALHEDNDLHWKIEKHFVFQEVVGKYGFLELAKNYTNHRMTLEEQEAYIKDLYSAIDDKDVHIKNQEKNMKKILHDKDVHIESQNTKINNLESNIQNLSELVESMRIKNRIKRLVKKIIPTPLWMLFKQIKQTINPTNTMSETAMTDPINYYVYRQPSFTQMIQDEIETFQKRPLISIIMPVYNVAPKWIDLAIKSIENQWYDHWELCIADDKSTNQETIEYLKNINNTKIKIKYLEENLNISGASNAAISLTSGEYIALMDNDDELTPDALYEVVKVINAHDTEFIYSDEDKLEMDGSHSDPNFKPDFAPDKFLSQNYLSHLGVIKKELITKVNGFTVGLEGSQDYDLYLKVLEHTDKVYHIEKVLYHWRKIPGSTAAEYSEKSYAQDAGRKALENAMYRRQIKASVKNGKTPGTYKVDYTLINEPLVSIIIPFKDKPELIKVCIESLLKKTTYDNFEIIGISNNSTEEKTFEEMKYLQSLDERVSFYEYNVAFNYSKINNYAVNTYAKGEQILFLNNDIEIITPHWIEEMLMYSQQDQNGAIGAKLYFPNGTIQHAGLIMAPKTIHSVILIYQGFPKEHTGYGARLQCVNNYSAVTAACLMVKRDIFEQINGFDEERLSVAYNDVDFCLRIQEAGYHNVWTPYCELYHHESISRGYEVSREAVERREKEKWNLKDKHPKMFTEGDPFYNKNLTRFSLGFELDESVKNTHESVDGIPFYEEILLTKHCREKTKNKVCIFSHYHAQDEIKDDVLYYIEELAKIMDVIFVSTAEGMNKKSIAPIEKYCTDIIIKKNIGYDFGAWKTGLKYLNSKINDYEHLILCNDSVFGPLYDLESIFEKMHDNDLWAMTDNHEIEYHLQSYFMVYSKKAFNHVVFRTFWENLKIYTNKQALIENNEIGYSQKLIHSDLSYDTYYRCKNKNYVNVLQYYWKELIIEEKFPFIKKEVLLRNPLNLDISDWKEVIENSTADYKIKFIIDNLH